MAAPMRVTVTMPMTMPMVARAERILLARTASQEIPRLSRISDRNFMGRKHRTSNIQHSTPKAQCPTWIPLDVQCSMLNVGCSFCAYLIAGNEAVADTNDSARLAGNIFLVGYDDDGV